MSDQQIHVAMFLGGLTVLVFLWGIAQRIGDWKSTAAARWLTGIATALTILWIYLGFLWFLKVDLCAVLTQQSRIFWIIVGASLMVTALVVTVVVKGGWKPWSGAFVSGDKGSPQLTFRGWSTPEQWAFPVPLNVCHLHALVIENAQLAVPNTAKKVVASINYQHADGRNKFPVNAATWKNVNPPGSDQPGSALTHSIDLAEGESQKLVVSMQRADGRVVASPESDGSYQELSLAVRVRTPIFDGRLKCLRSGL